MNIFVSEKKSSQKLMFFYFFRRKDVFFMSLNFEGNWSGHMTKTN